jgi:arabinogalactan endo-1,4-beta-galactosidase
MAAWCGTQYAGGDISLLPKYEEKGAIYYDENGKRITDMLSYLKATGLNAMRVRLFVDPSKANAEDQGEGVCQDLPFVASLGQRIKAAGFKLLLDIHYSDTWTDPGQHSTPSSWTVQSALADSVYSYTKRVLYTLIAAGATPDFIQVGNEVTYGMLWPTGHCYPNGTNYGNGTFETFANYLKCGIQACREVCPNAKIVVHTEMSRASNVISFYNTLKDYTTDFDIIGLSYYPYWHGGISVLDGLLTTLENSYPDKKIQIVETGYPHAYYPSGANYDLQSTWPATEAGQKDFASALVETLNAHHNVNGLYWWFPEANEYGISYVNHVTTDWYNCGWWDNQNGQVMDALFEVAKYADNSEDEPTDSASIYIVGGEGNWNLTEPLAKMTYSGNGIYVDTLTISAPIYFVFADGGPEYWNNDWTAFNANYRYGPTATTTVTTGTTYSTAKRDNNYSYYFTGDGSDYLFTFDVDNLTFTLDRVGLLGDVNNDRQVNIQDVTILIDYLLGSTMTSFDTTNADVNQDKTINIADVTSLIDRLLAG